jgi:hypothetical protein
MAAISIVWSIAKGLRAARRLELERAHRRARFTVIRGGLA